VRKNKSVQRKRRPTKHKRQAAPTATQSHAEAHRREDLVSSDDVEVAAIEQKVLQYMRGLVSGEREPRPMTLTFPADLLRELWPFFESQAADWHNNRVCDLAKLAEILKTKPLLLWHPLVLRIIRHLRDVRRYWSTDMTIADGAEMELRTLVEAVASGLLGGTWALKPPGWLLKPRPRRPGRKRDEYIDAIELELRDGADYLMKALRAGPQRDKGESEDQYLHRVATLVKRVWAQSPFAQELGDPEPTDFGVPVDDQEIRWKEIPPPPGDRIIKWVREAFKHRTETGRSIQSRLTWKMLAYRYELTENQVRWGLDAARGRKVKPSGPTP
jgi:hypothetical protein